MEIISNNNIPLSTLPQWPRFDVVERTVVPKQQRDHHSRNEVHRLECDQCGGPVGADGRSAAAANNFSGIDIQELARHLDKSIQFLKAQQHELLTGLHEEVDKLKKENRDLQYKVVMANEHKDTAEAAKNFNKVDNSVKKPTVSHTEQSQDQIIKRLKVEVDELKAGLEEAKQKNGLLEKVLDQQSSIHGASMDDIGDDAQQQIQLSMHTRALEHCDRIIKHLQLVNEHQALEVTRLKAELKDLLATYRPAPDIGLLSNRNKMMADAVRLPKLAGELFNHRPLSPDVVPPALSITAGTSAAPSQNMGQAGTFVVTNSLVPRPPSQPPPHAHQGEANSGSGAVELGKATIHLPPLKQVVPTRIAERKKQIEVLHKARLRQLSSNATNNNSGTNNKQ